MDKKQLKSKLRVYTHHFKTECTLALTETKICTLLSLNTRNSGES